MGVPLIHRGVHVRCVFVDRVKNPAAASTIHHTIRPKNGGSSGWVDNPEATVTLRNGVHETSQQTAGIKAVEYELKSAIDRLERVRKAKPFYPSPQWGIAFARVDRAAPLIQESSA
jgi:hypothetical protein